MTDIVKILIQSGLLTYTYAKEHAHASCVSLPGNSRLPGVIVGFNYVVQFHFKRWRLGQP